MSADLQIFLLDIELAFNAKVKKTPDGITTITIPKNQLVNFEDFLKAKIQIIKIDQEEINVELRGKKYNEKEE